MNESAPHENISITASAEVVVAGAGPGGFAAALQAARMGCSVILVEKFDMPGGVHTSGLQGSANEGVGGIHTELMQRFDAAGYIYTATEKTHPDWAGNPLSHYERMHKPDASFSRASFNPEGAGAVMTAMLDEAGVDAWYGARFVDCIMDKSGGSDDQIKAIIVETASGRHAIAGKIFIDGSGTAEMVARSGAPYIGGGGGQPDGADWDGVNRPIPGGLLWMMSGIDFSQTARHQKTADDPKLEKLIAEASAAGDIPPGLYRPKMGGNNVYGEHYIGHPTLDMSPMVEDGTYIIWQNVPYEWALHMDERAEDNAKATRALRMFVDAEAQFLKNYVPGFENAVLRNVGRYVGIRDGRHPVGEYVFGLDDARESRTFRDAVTSPMTKTFFWDGYAKHTFQIPWRCFLPKKVSNLVLTGASLSFTYETIFMVMRNFPWCTQTGEIAGYGAARAVEKKISPKELEWDKPYF